MADLLSTSLSGMIAFQRALDLTGHNIANANTPGYSRQVAEFSAREGQGSGNGFIGSGTAITTVKRSYDAFVGEQLQVATSSYSRFNILETLAARVDTLLADPQTGLNGSLQSFFNALQDVNNDPASIPAREALLGEAEGLTNRFQAMDRTLQDLGNEVSQRVSQSVRDINGLSSAIAELNDRIVLAEGRAGGQPANDLLDQRDKLVRELSSHISVSTVTQDDGTINIYIGAGQALVNGKFANQLGVSGSEFDPTRLEVVFEDSSGSTAISGSLTGGTLGGLLEFRTRMLDPTRQALGETAQALAGSFNEQHRAGMDLRGALGGDFFTAAAPTVLRSSGNTGTGIVDVSVQDLALMSNTDYILEFDGAAYSLSRADNGAPVPMGGSGSAADPYTADGLSIVISAPAAAGDRFLIRPAADAAASIGVAVADPQSLAIANPVRTLLADTNIGDASIGPARVVDATDPNLLTTSVIQFIDANTYSIDGAGAFAYTSGDPIVINGAEFAIDGIPFAGDTFTLELNAGGTGDNANGQSLVQVQFDSILDGGTVSINENYGQLVAAVGSTTRQVQSSLDAQSVILENVNATYLSKSGVNLDEEAANLVRFQQSYQAAAQVVAVANTLFQSLLAATGR
ncbi:MAG: flagellar hook-associated protein FlgK [Gammaproteobacteria bacterium]|nr:flagellar hook-associated protein FlgK [Gammaproteobacteria bacterium]